MADLIDRDKLFHGQVILVSTEDGRKAVQDVMNAIWNAPTVDAVEVVRCKDCKYYNGDYWECDIDVCVKPNGYCSYGERRETDG